MTVVRHEAAHQFDRTMSTRQVALRTTLKSEGQSGLLKETQKFMPDRTTALHDRGDQMLRRDSARVVRAEHVYAQRKQESAHEIRIRGPSYKLNQRIRGCGSRSGSGSGFR